MYSTLPLKREAPPVVRVAVYEVGYRDGSGVANCVEEVVGGTVDRLRHRSR